MSMTDPIADFLSRIRNGLQSRKLTIDCPRSSLKLRIAEILRDEGFLDGVSEADDELQGTISLTLRYDNAHHAAITGIKRISRPGQRRYVGSKGLRSEERRVGKSVDLGGRRMLKKKT